jgi:hypothetical protein
MSSISKGSGLNSQNLSGMSGSKLSSRLSTQSKRKLITMNSEDKKLQYQKFYQDIAVNRDKIRQDEARIDQKLSELLTQEQKDSVLTQANFPLYGKGIIRLEDLYVHSHMFVSYAAQIERQDFEHFKDLQTIVAQKTSKANSQLALTERIFNLNN